MNDLWQFNISSYQWIWLGGRKEITFLTGTYVASDMNSISYPGPRHFGQFFFGTNDETLYLFGGLGYATANASTL